MLNLNWDEYRAKMTDPAMDADADRRQTARLEQRLEVLRHCRTWFENAASFVHINPLERKAIAGTIRSEADSKSLLRQHRTTVDFGIFGSMSASGVFRRHVTDKKGALALSRAVDAVPLTGAVTAKHYGKFIEEFTRTLDFENPLATSSRLLAMKRPDVFVCVTSGNERGLAEMLGMKVADMTVQTYWDQVIEPIHKAPWHQAPEPADATDHELWRGRVALLDLAFAEPRD